MEDGLLAFNVAVIGDPQVLPYGIFVRDDDNAVVGGLVGVVKWRWLYVDKLWLPETLRGAGFGTRLMQAAEDFAREHDCLGVYLDTFEYQALPFYVKLGYTVFGVHEGYPPGYRQYCLSKTFASSVGR